MKKKLNFALSKARIATLVIGVIVVFAVLITAIRFQLRPQADASSYVATNTANLQFTQPDESIVRLASNTVSVLVEQPDASEFRFLKLSGKRLSPQRFQLEAVTNKKSKVTFSFAYYPKDKPVPTSIIDSSLDRKISLSTSTGLSHTADQSGNANTYIVGRFTAVVAGKVEHSPLHILKDTAGVTLTRLVDEAESGGAELEEGTEPASPVVADNGLFTEITGSRSAHQLQPVSLSASTDREVKQVRAEYRYWPAATAFPAEPGTLDRSVNLTASRDKALTYTAAWNGNANQHVIFRIIVTDTSGAEVRSGYYVLDAAKGSVAKPY